MTATVLATIPSPSQGVWYIGGFPLRAYALCIIVGIVVAVWWGGRRWRARGGRDGEVLDVAIWAVPFGLVGGRLYHLATDWRTYFGDGPKTPVDALKIWDGGLGIWGAVFLGAVGAWIGARRAGIRLPPFGDAIAPAILLAQAIGRLGNYFNQELYGAHTSLPWGLEIYDRVDRNGNVGTGLIDGVSTGRVVDVVQPTFLYELIWNLLVVVALVAVDRRMSIGHGRLFALYVAGYCLGRFVIEFLREDTATHVFGVRVNVFTAAIVFLLAVVYVVVARRGRESPDDLHREPPDPPEREDSVGGDDDAEAATENRPTPNDPDSRDPDTTDPEPNVSESNDPEPKSPVPIDPKPDDPESDDAAREPDSDEPRQTVASASAEEHPAQSGDGDTTDR